MFLKSVDIQGFKSFPDKLHLDFAPGITAIVGPNGSGKSNVAEAIRWVLGEQSAKSLRGTKMEDVIFLGTAARKPVGFAEVSVTIDNSDKALPIEYNEVMITRRYFRSGESEYMINRTVCRLRDIHELFMDTGLGRDGYSMIGQGKIAEILSIKSEDRREVFEEAAGISKFRYRKTETERKLKATEENLVRARDIMADLSQRIDPLERESKKARLFLDYREERKGLELGVWLKNIEDGRAEAEKLRGDFQNVRCQSETVTVALEATEAESERKFEENQRNSIQIESLHIEIREQNEKKSKMQNHRSLLENDREHQVTAQRDLLDGRDQSDHKLQQLEEEIKSKEEEVRTLSLQKEELARREQMIADTLAHTASESAEAWREICGLDEEIAARESDLADRRIRITALRTDVEHSARQGEALQGELSATQKELDEASGQSAAFARELTSLKEEAQSLDNVVEGYRKKAQAKQTQKDENEAALQKISLQIEKKSHEANLLRDMERHYEGFGASVKAVMQWSVQGRLGGIRGPVSGLIKADTEVALAIETALGAAIQQIVVESEQDAKAAIFMLKKDNIGRATFLPMTTVRGKALPESDFRKAPGYIGIASALVVCDDIYRPIVDFLLGRTVVVESLDNAIALSAAKNSKVRIATLDGQLMNPGGSMTGGSTVRSAGVLTRKNDIQQLDTERKALEEQALEIEGALKKNKEEWLFAKAQMEATQARIRTISDEYIRLAALAQEKTLQLQGFETRLEALKQAQTALLSGVSTAQDQILSEEKELQTAEDRLSQLESTREEKNLAHQGLKQKAEADQQRLSESKLESLAAAKDLESALAAAEAIRERQQNFDLESEKREAQIVQLQRQSAAIQEQIAASREEEARIDRSIADTQSAIEELSALRSTLEQSITMLRKESKEQSRQKELLAKEEIRLEEKILSLESRQESLLARLWDEYELTFSAAVAQRPQIEDYRTAESRISELRSLMKELGDVNVLAVEEFAEVKEKHDFFSTQITDLENSKVELLAVIRDLTKQMQEVFLDQFALINKSFSKTFADLFGGGSAKLELADPEDALQCGIEIFVEPPGKIIKNLSSLSGGEQAFVAIALYFAIMQVRPTPFCVMDEIDAALDNPNVIRFANYLRNFKSTQFIVITHRRGTMEAADMLYGVTMQEQGVSQTLVINVAEIESRLGMDAQ